MRVFFNLIVIQILLNVYVYWRGRQALSDHKLIQGIFAGVFVAEILTYFIAYFGSHLLPEGIFYDLAWLGTAWAVFIIYLSGLLLLYDFVKFVDKKKGIVRKYADLNKKRLRFTYFCASTILVLGVMLYGSYRFNNPVITNIDLTIHKTSPEVKKLKIVMVSDVHVGYLIDRDILSMYVDKIMEQKPDLILIAGDIIDYNMEPVREQRMEEEFKRLKAPYGVFASTGNHDFIQLEEEDKDEKLKWLANESGLTLLRDSVVLVANSFYIVGRDDDKNKERKSIAEIVKDVNTDYPLIVMNHEPHRLDEEVEAGADIAVYGHTHNGQIFPNNILVKFMYEVAYGYKKKGNTHIYVSSGLGLAGPQFRIGTISEIVVLNVEFNN